MKPLLLVLLPGISALAGLTGSSRAEISYRTISGNPLTIYAAQDLSIQVKYYGQTDHQVYSPDEYLGSSGFLAWINGTVYSPDFDNHPSPGSQCDTFTAWSYVSQSGPTGSGTQGSPWQIVTVVDAGSSGIRVTETVSYVDGQKYFRLDRAICNSSGGSASATVFHAADFYLQGSDSGYGYYNDSNGSVGGYNSAMDWFEIFAPITPASAYQEGYYGDVWHAVATGPTSPGPGFDNTLDVSLVDNGAGLQWSAIPLPDEDCATVSMWWSFGVDPEIPATPTPSVMETPTPTPTLPAVKTPTPVKTAPPVETPTPETAASPTPPGYFQDAEFVDAWIDPPVGLTAGQTGAVYGRFHNTSTLNGSPAPADFDARIIVTKPESTATYAYITGWGFTADQYRNLVWNDYLFNQPGSYNVQVEIYAPGAKDAGWPVSRRYDCGNESFTIPAATPSFSPTPQVGATPTPPGYVLGAEAEDVWLFPAEVVAGMQADIYGRYRNMTLQEDEPAPAVFDARIVVWFPDGGATSGSLGGWAFSAGQAKDLRFAEVNFQQPGIYTVVAEIYDQEGSESGWASVHRLDSHQEIFEVPSPSLPRYLSVASGDYDGDGTDDPAIYRPSEGLWIVRGVTRVYFGQSADLPVSGDYDGDGTSELAYYRPTNGFWKVRGLTQLYYARTGSLPVPGDYTGNGTTDIAVFFESIARWMILGVSNVYFGRSGDIPVPADYDGDGRDDLAYFRGETTLWKIRGISQFYFGQLNDWAVPGDYAGDGTALPAICRPLAGLWLVRGLTRSYFTRGAVLPAPADYTGAGVDDIGFFNGYQGLWKVPGILRFYFGCNGDIPVTR